MPRASDLADQLSNSTQVFDHRESISTRRRISIETEACAQRYSKCLSPCHNACTECCAPLTDRLKKCKGPHGCRCASSSAGALGVLACLATTITLLVVWLQHELAPPIPSPPSPRVSRCSAGIESTYIVQKDESCSLISRNHGVPRFDIVDRNTTRSCCESDAIEAGDIVEFCKPSPRGRWRARGLPQEKIVMTYIGGVGFLPAPTRLPESVNVVALAFAVDATGQGDFELGTHPQCDQPECGVYQGDGFDADCSTQNNPSEITGRRGRRNETLALQNVDNSRRWLVSIVPRDNNLWPYFPGWDPGDHGNLSSSEQWGKNAAESLESIILRYRLDGIDVDFEGYLDPSHYETFTSALCALFSALRERLPNVVISIALYGNPEMPEACPGRCTIGQYLHLKDTCGDLVDIYLYQNYANQKDDQDTNKRYIENVGNLFGWEKFAFGVGVGGEPWRWYPDEDHPGSAGEIILSDLLQGPNGQYIRGVFTWAGEFSDRCTPSWCVEDLLAGAITPAKPAPATCTCGHGALSEVALK